MEKYILFLLSLSFFYFPAASASLGKRYLVKSRNKTFVCVCMRIVLLTEEIFQHKINHRNSRTFMRLISYAQANQGSQHVQNTRTVWESGQQQKVMPQGGTVQCMTESKTDNPVSAHFFAEGLPHLSSVGFAFTLATCRSSFLSMLGKVNMLSAHASLQQSATAYTKCS